MLACIRVREGVCARERDCVCVLSTCMHTESKCMQRERLCLCAQHVYAYIHTYNTQALKAMLEKLTHVDVAIHVFAVCVCVCVCAGEMQCVYVFMCVCVYVQVSAESMRVHAFAVSLYVQEPCHLYSDCDILYGGCDAGCVK